MAYVVKSQVSPTDYVISTPERRRKTWLCHVNMLKPFLSRDVNQGKGKTVPLTGLEKRWQALDRDVVNLLYPPSLFGDVSSRTSVLSHDTDVGSAAPIKHAYRCPLPKREVMKQETEYLLVNGLAKPSSSPSSSP